MKPYLVLGAVFLTLSFFAHPAAAHDKEEKACGGHLVKMEAGPQLTVTSDQATCDWPFTAQSVTLACDSSKGTTAIYASTDDGVRYALSEEASSLPDIQPIDQILKDDPNSDDGKADDDTWADIGLALCR